MTITRLWQTGWEWNQAALETISANLSAVSAQAKTGTYSLQLTGAATATYQALAAAIAQTRLGLHFRQNGTSTGSTPQIFSLRSAGTSVAEVTYNNATGEWRAVCGATVVETVISAMTTNTWYHIGVDIKIDAAAGWFYVYLDGVPIITFDGDTNDGGANLDRLYLGYTNASHQWGNTAYMDDVYWDETTGEIAPAAPPDLRFYMIAPNADGNYSQWDGNDGNSVNNYLLVDEIAHDSDTTYVSTSTTTEKDSYNATTVAIPGGFSIAAVIPQAVMRKSSAGGTVNAKIGTRYAGNDVVSATKTLATSYSLHSERQVLAPDGGDWDQTKLDAVELLIEAD